MLSCHTNSGFKLQRMQLRWSTGMEMYTSKQRSWVEWKDKSKYFLRLLDVFVSVNFNQSRQPDKKSDIQLRNQHKTWSPHNSHSGQDSRQNCIPLANCHTLFPLRGGNFGSTQSGEPLSHNPSPVSLCLKSGALWFLYEQKWRGMR